MHNATMDENVTESILKPEIPISAQVLLEMILNTYPEYRLSQSLNMYGYITEIVLGSVFNLLALIVMLGLTRLPICNYMAALAISDLSVVLGPCLIRWLLTQNHDAKSTNTALCRLLYFQSYCSFSISAWILVAMTIDRYIAITFPLKALRFSTPRRAQVIILAIVLIFAVINTHFFFTVHVRQESNIQEGVCVAYDHFKYFIEVIWTWMDATIYSFLPFIFLLVFNLLIIKNYGRSIKQNLTLKGSTGAEKSAPSLRHNQKLTVTLLVVSFTFILLTSPKVILLIIQPTVFNFKPEPHIVDFKILAQYTLTSTIVNLLMYSNHCINFFLYCLTGRKFREQLINTVKPCVIRKARRIRVAPFESSTEMSTTISRRLNSFNSVKSDREKNSNWTKKFPPSTRSDENPAIPQQDKYRHECNKSGHLGPTMLTIHENSQDDIIGPTNGSTTVSISQESERCYDASMQSEFTQEDTK